MRPPERATGTRGFALIVVLWALALLSAVTVALATIGRSDVALTHNLVETARAAHLADAGVYLGIRRLLTADGLPAPDNDGGRWLRTRIDGVDVAISLSDESGKVDLNQAPGRLLRAALLAAGATASVADRLADAIADWRDGDDSRRDFGAEAAAYRRAGMPDGPRNGPFETFRELRLVLGMSDDLFRRVAPFVTVASRQSGLDPRHAPAQLLRAVPELSAADVARLLDARRDAPPDTLANTPLPPIAGGAGILVGGHGQAHTVTAEVALPSGVSYRRQALVVLTGAAERPFRIRAWRAPGYGLPALATP